MSVAATAVAALCALPAGAGAGAPVEGLGKAKGLAYVKTTIQNVVSHASLSATCPGARAPVGGGAALGGPVTQARLNETSPVPQALAWQAAGRSLTAGGRALTTYAICTRKPVGYESSPSTSIAPGGSFLAEVPCGISEFVTNGGWSSSNSADLRSDRSMPADPYWKGRMRNADPGVSTNVQVWTVCSEDLDPRRETVTETVGNDDPVRLIAKCKPGEAVTGGGFYNRGSGHPSVTAPWDSSDAGKTPEDGWVVKHINENAAAKVTAYALCIG